MLRIWIALFIAMAAAPAPAAAQNLMLPFQGILTDGEGAPLPDGNYNLTFRLYPAASGGTASWSEAALVPVVGGIFNVMLGSVTSLQSISFGQPFWLGIQVGAGEELAPRVALGSTPYSFHALTVANKAVDTDALADAAVTASKLADAAVATTHLANSSVTSAKLAPSAVTSTRLANQSVTGAKIATAGATSGQTLIYNGTSVVWQTPAQGFDLPFTGSVSRAGNSAFNVTNTSTTGPAWGVMGVLSSTSGSGIYGWAEAGSGTAHGVIGRSQSSAGIGVYGFNDAATGTTYGVRGLVQSPNGYGGYFEGRGYFAGYLGVGTSSPTSRLHLQSPGTESDIAINMKVGGSWTAQIIQTNNSDFQFSNGGNVRMTVRANGNVGVGTTSPQTRLDVDGDARVSGELRSTRNGSANMMPIAYGMVTSGGSLRTGSGNVTVSRTGTGSYRVTIADENFYYENYVVTATPVSAGITIRAGSAGGNLLIHTNGAFGGSDSGFYFVVYKP